MRNIATLCLPALLLVSSSLTAQSWFRAEANPKSPWKNPGTTAVYSFFLPGAGYFSNDKIATGFTTLGTELLLVGAGLYLYTQRPIDSYDYMGNACFIAAGSIHLFQFVHSTILTHKSNKLNGYAHNRPGKNEVRLSLGYTGRGLGMQLHF